MIGKSKTWDTTPNDFNYTINTGIKSRKTDKWTSRMGHYRPNETLFLFLGNDSQNREPGNTLLLALLLTFH